jgi:hypothetical protein
MDGRGNSWIGYDRTNLPTNSGTFGLLVRNGISVGTSYQSTTPPSNGAIIQGNVGIGTTSPQNKLHVEITNEYARISNPSTGNGGIKISYQNSDTHGLHLTYNPGSAISYIDNTYPISSGQVYGDIYFRQNSAGTMTTRMMIKADGGSVGIGTTTITDKLEVRGADNGITISSLSANRPVLQFVNGSTMMLKLSANGTYGAIADTTGDVMIFKGGNVGIGNTDPNYKLRVDGTLYTSSTARFNGVVFSDSRLMVGVAGGDQTYASVFVGGALTSGTNQYALLLDPQLAGTSNYGLLANARIKASTAVTNAYGVYIINSELLSGASIANNYGLYIASQTNGSSVNYAIYSAGGLNYFGGNVGIGTTSPAEKLHIDAGSGIGARIVSSAFSGIEYHNTNGTWKVYVGTESGGGGARYNSADSQHTFYNNSSAVVRINSSGNVGIGTTSPGGRLHVATPDPASNFIAIDFRNPSYGIYAKTNSIGSRGNTLEFTATDYNLGGTVVTRDVLTLRPEGSVGIGTTAPDRLVTIAPSSGDSYINLKRPSGTTQSTIEWNTNGTNNWLLRTDDTSADLKFYSYSTSNYVMTLKYTNGNVGIGSTAPGVKLDVNGQIRSYASTGQIYSYSTTSSNTAVVFAGWTGGTGVQIGYLPDTAQGYFENTYPITSGQVFGDIYFRQNSAGTMTTRMMIKADGGSVLIGATNADVGGSVAGTVIRQNGTATICFNDSSPANYQSPIAADRRNTAGDGLMYGMWRAGIFQAGIGATNGQIMTFFTGDGSNSSQPERMRIIRNGNVGIGTTSPSGILHVTSPVITAAAPSLGWPVYNAEADTNSRPIYIDTLGNSNVSTAGYGATVSIILGQYYDSRIVITPSGNGGASPGDQGTGRGKDLMLKAGTSDNGAGYKGGRLYLNGGMGYQSAYNANVGDILMQTLTGGGNVGIGTTSAAYVLDVSGTIRATGDVIAYSDARVKDNIQTVEDALNKIKSLRGVTYIRKDSDDKSTKVGVIAQEVMKILPEVVQQDNNGNYSVAYGNMVGVLIEAIKEQQQQIDELKYLLSQK